VARDAIAYKIFSVVFSTGAIGTAGLAERVPEVWQRYRYLVTFPKNHACFNAGGHEHFEEDQNQSSSRTYWIHHMKQMEAGLQS
jgi:hypothetical protein